MIIHGSTPKSKKRKVSKADQLRNDLWLKQIDAMTPKIKKVPMFKSTYSLSPAPGRQTTRYPSLSTGLAVATKAPPKVYTGDKVIGIATMHKSNAVPVFTDEQAVEISSMRR